MQQVIESRRVRISEPPRMQKCMPTQTALSPGHVYQRARHFQSLCSLHLQETIEITAYSLPLCTAAIRGAGQLHPCWPSASAGQSSSTAEPYALLFRSQLVGLKEESTEFGGTFISNGIERIIRMLILQRRHYVMALRRSAYLKRGSTYTDQATLLRQVHQAA